METHSPLGKGTRAKLARTTSTSAYGPNPSIQVGHLSFMYTLLLMFFMHSLPKIAIMRPEPDVQKGRLGPMPFIPGVWRTVHKDR